jgi:hypothetical protein
MPPLASCSCHGDDSQTVVATRAFRLGCGIPEISEHESPTALLGVRVFLNRLQLGKLCSAAAIENGPVDLEFREWGLHIRQIEPISHAFPHQELPILKRVQ